MIDVPSKRQPTIGSCLPTAVLAVLEYYERFDVTMEEIGRMCRVSSGGFSNFETAMDGLANEFEVEQMEGDWERIVEAMLISGDPVVVTIAHPFLSAQGDHAVVLIDLTDDEQVVYMDPATGNRESLPLHEFEQWWDAPGQRAFVLRT